MYLVNDDLKPDQIYLVTYKEFTDIRRSLKQVTRKLRFSESFESGAHTYLSFTPVRGYTVLIRSDRVLVATELERWK